jgi:hypothetical protein
MLSKKVDLQKLHFFARVAAADILLLLLRLIAVANLTLLLHCPESCSNCSQALPRPFMLSCSIPTVTGTDANAVKPAMLNAARLD